jgi:hypothetical protein
LVVESRRGGQAILTRSQLGVDLAGGSFPQ